MCGICGFNSDDKTLIKKMTDEIAHRGPNAEGVFCSKDISLGSRRLSIIDLSTSANQPLYNEDGAIALVYNGEIFNFMDVKKKLEKNHTFKSHTDSEVLIHAYEEYGTKCLEMFNGFWGFAIYDSKKRQIFLARDRLGLKPLYYFYDGKSFVFGSEIKSILLHPDVERKINKEALSQFMTYRYIPSENTIFQNIKKLKPGHYIIFDIKSCQLKIEKYWDIDIKASIFLEKEAGKKIISLLSDSVRLRMISDVQIGAYLSGGIDSSSIVAMMKKYTDDVKTFSLAFEDDDLGNELEYSKFVSDHFATDHKEIVIGTDITKELPKIVWHLDEPMSDPAAVPVYFLSKEAKKDVTVVLTGDGADELYAGYDQYKFMALGNKISRLPMFAKKMVSFTVKNIPDNILNLIYRYSTSTGKKMFDRFDNFIMNVKDNKAKSYIEVVSVFNEQEQEKLLKFKPFMDYENINEQYFKGKSDFLSQVSYFDTKRYLPEDLLMKPDKMCMANGIEARVPYLDYRLVEHAFSIDPSLKIKSGKTKYILKKSLKKILPDSIINRKKQPFQVPLHKWMSKDFMNTMKDLALDRSMSKYFERKEINKVFDRFKSSKLYYGRQIFSIGTFSIWHKQYMEGEGTNFRI